MLMKAAATGHICCPLWGGESQGPRPGLAMSQGDDAPSPFLLVLHNHLFPHIFNKLILSHCPMLGTQHLVEAQPAARQILVSEWFPGPLWDMPPGKVGLWGK